MNKLIPIELWQSGSECRIRALGKDATIAQRLAQMGILPGMHLRIAHVSPFGGTVEVSAGQGQVFAMGARELSSLDCELIAQPLLYAAQQPPQRWRIRQFNGGAGFRQRMQAKGLQPGTILQVLPHNAHSVTVQSEQQSQPLHLGAGEAKKIIVERTDAA